MSSLLSGLQQEGIPYQQTATGAERTGHAVVDAGKTK